MPPAIAVRRFYAMFSGGVIPLPYKRSNNHVIARSEATWQSVLKT